MSGTSVLRGRDQESYLAVDVTGSTGRTLTTVEAVKKTLRFTGTLGQSITIRVPLSVTENPGYSGTFENATSGGFTITIAPVTGGGVAIASGTAITCWYDGAAMIGTAAPAVTGLPGTVSGVSTLFPLVITNPQIGEAITFSGSGGGTFINTPVGAAIGSAVTSGTVGSVLFIGASGFLQQDNANFFWDDTNNRLGLGTAAAPVARLHVLDDANAILARFHGENLFSSVFFELGDDSVQAAVRIYPGIAASGGNTLVESGGVILRAHYWSGSASVPVDAGWVTHVTATTPVYYLAGQVAGVDRIHIRQDGQTTLGSSTPNTSGAITETLVLNGTVFLNGATRINDTVNIALGTGTGSKIATASSQLMGFWGNTPRVRGSVSGATTEALLDNTLTYLSSIGIIDPFVSPLSLSPWLFVDPRGFAGAHNDPVGTLTDISGNSRSALAAGSLRGLLQVSSNLSPNGSRTISLDGVDDSYDFTGAMFSVTNGVMITVAANFSTNAGAGQVIFTDDTHGRPQCIVETFTTNLYAFRDEGHTITFGAFSAGWQVLQWVFRPPSGGTGLAELWRNGVQLTPSASPTWNWNPGASAGFIISGGTLPAKCFLGPIIVTVGDVTDQTREGLRSWIGAHY